jgi:hypothetical protein
MKCKIKSLFFGDDYEADFEFKCGFYLKDWDTKNIENAVNYHLENCSGKIKCKYIKKIVFNKNLFGNEIIYKFKCGKIINGQAYKDNLHKHLVNCKGVE